MLFLLLIGTASLAFAAGAEVKDELKPEESIIRGYSDGLELMRQREENFNAHRQRVLSSLPEPAHQVTEDLDEHDLPGPVILRTPGPLPSPGHPDIEAQNKIIADVFSPDYYQPTWVLDYRYLKTGGRDYTRGPGGQILILPKGVHTKEHKEFPDYDAYIEHLRLSRLAERQHHKHDNHERDHWRDHAGHGKHEQGHGQTMWHKYG